MSEYYVIKNKNTGLYFRGKGVNRWGKHYNQASIYRVRGMAEHTIKEVSWKGEQAEIVPVQIIENTADVTETRYGKWVSASNKPGVHIGMKCSLCGARIKYSEFLNGNHNYCYKCGAKMKGGNENA